jgi:hypothetical protein
VRKSDWMWLLAGILAGVLLFGSSRAEARCNQNCIDRQKQTEQERRDKEAAEIAVRQRHSDQLDISSWLADCRTYPSKPDCARFWRQQSGLPAAGGDLTDLEDRVQALEDAQ